MSVFLERNFRLRQIGLNSDEIEERVKALSDEKEEI